MWCCWNLATASRHRGRVPGREQRGKSMPATRPLGTSPLGDHASHVSRGRQLREAWVPFLRRWEWEWFCTLTFRHDVHPEAAAKRFEGLAARMNDALHGPRWYKHRVGIEWVRAVEYQRRGVIHFHAVIAGARGERPSVWEEVWDDLAGYGKIEPIRNTAAVLRYLSKYVGRGGEPEFEPRMGTPGL